MKTPKVANAMNNIDDQLITSSERGNKKKHGALIKAMSLVATFAIVLGVGLLAIPMIGVFAETSTVAIDVNPSIEIEVNRKDRVVEVNALNEDAETILADLELEKKDINEAIYLIVEKMFAEGKLSAEQNALLLSVDSKNDKKADALKQNALAKIGEAFGAVKREGEEQITPAIIVQDYKKNDNKNNQDKNEKCSPAKATLIKKVIEAGLKDADGVAYTAEQLEEMNMHELMLLLDVKGVKVDGAHRNDVKVNKQAFATEEEVIAFVYETVGITADRVTGEVEVDMDFCKGGIVYEIEFVIDGVECEYEVSAKKEGMRVVGMGCEEKTEEKDEHEKDEHEKLPEGTALITEAEAIERVKLNAKIDADIDAEIELEGRVYEIEFNYDGFEYEYKIDAVSGKILGVDKDMHIDLGKPDAKPEPVNPDQWGHHGFGFGNGEPMDKEPMDKEEYEKNDFMPKPESDFENKGEGKPQPMPKEA